MAIDTGIALDCAGLVEVGGLHNIYITDIATLTAVTVGAAGTHEYTNLTKTGWAMFQLKPSTSSWNTTASKENGVTRYETTVQFYIPNITSAKLHILEDMKNACIVAVGQFRDGKKMTCGISEEYKGTGNGSDYWKYSKTYAHMSLEGTSGTDFADGNGATVTLTATSFETPRAYTGTITPGASNTTANLA
tara:strand:- start:977 stop:1549 length:573 start_codon:yes stop_codon:yes gene_type:complete